MFQAKLHIFINIQSILNGLPSNLHKVGLIFLETITTGGNNPLFKAKLHIFSSNSSYASQSILNRLSPNLHKVGLIFRHDHNKG